MNPFIALLSTAFANRGGNGYAVPHEAQAAGSCVVKPGMEPWKSHCDSHVSDQAGCITYAAFCDWTSGGGVTPTTAPTAAPTTAPSTTQATNAPPSNTTASNGGATGGGCSDLGAECVKQLNGSGWSGQCNTKYSAWSGALEYDASGTLFTGRVFGEVCPQSCANAPATTQGVAKSCAEWMASDLSYDGSAVNPPPTITTGAVTTAPVTTAPAVTNPPSNGGSGCVGKPGFEPWHVRCEENATNHAGCNQYVAFCDWLDESGSIVSPTVPTSPPTTRPTSAPTVPTEEATWPTDDGSSSNDVMNDLERRLRSADYSDILKWQVLTGIWEPSNLYKAPDLLVAVKKAIETGVGSFHLFDFADENVDVTKKSEYAMVNLAAFLAQSMQETIQYDACDENNWDWESYPGGSFPLTHRSASACGQLGQNYQNYTCGEGVLAPDGEKFECEVDPDMEIVATTNSRYWGAPGPLYCGPKSKMPLAPIWLGTEAGGDCKDWNNGGADTSYRATTFDEVAQNIASGVKCSEYGPGQLAGGWTLPSDASESMTHSGFDNVEGCCWWGRGVIQTTGICNFGKLNYYLGARAKKREGSALYGNVDFCRNPGEICANPEYPDLKWFAGLFYYMQEVQTWNTHEMNYYQEVMDLVNSNYEVNKLTSFINKVSGIVNRGCPLANCGNGPLHAGPERVGHFKTVLKGFGLRN